MDRIHKITAISTRCGDLSDIFCNMLQGFQCLFIFPAATRYALAIYRSACLGLGRLTKMGRLGLLFFGDATHPGRSRTPAMPRRSLIDYLREYPKHGRSTAFVQRSGYRTSRTTYAEVAALAAQCAREFEGLGIAPGDRILLWGRNSAEWVAAFFGCILRGAVVVPMDQGATAEFADRVARQVDAKLAFADRGNILISNQRPVILLDALRECVGRHSREPYDSPSLHRSSIAQIIFTSGATAEPKGVVISHGNILANLEPLEAGMQPYLKWERFVHPLRLLDLVPVSHVFGQFMGVWIPPLLGACVYFQDSLNPSEIISTIRRERSE